MATAKSRWETLNGKRHAILDRARQCADITIPALMPPEGHTENSNLPTPYQSLGARGVNNLASKLSLSLLPAGNSFFRLQVPAAVAAALQSRNEIEEAFRQIENQAMRQVETSNFRVTLHSTIKQLVVVGNALLYMPDEGGARMFRLTQYCVVRDPMGAWHEIVLKESVHPSTLDPEILAKVDYKPNEQKKDEPIDVFTWVRREGKKAVWHQEINEKVVPGSEGRTKYEECPYIPLRWSAIENEDYGRGHVEEYLGDLRSLEDLSKSIVAFSAAAAKIIWLERPNSSTDVEAIEEAESGEIVTGNPEDLTALQLEKYPDFKVAKETVNDLTLRLSHAFLLTTGTVRDAERVTAEEIRMQAQELEDVLGGVYTVLAQELQLRIVRRLLAQLRKSGDFPELPEGSVEPVIVTGFDALGRGHELNKYRAYFADMQSLYGEQIMQRFDDEKVAKLMATHHNVDIDGLLKTDQQLEQDQANAVGATVLDKAAGPVAGAVAKAAVQQ